jgi:hypothetical protein
MRLKDTRKFTVGEKLTSAILVAVGVFVVFSDYYGMHRFLLMVFLIFVGVPYMWNVLRGEESTDRGEINMDPEKLTRIHRDDASEFVYDNPYVQERLKRLKEEYRKDKGSNDEEEQN